MEIREVQVHDIAVHCDRCGARFHPSETHRDSGGYCECGGALVLEQQAWVRQPAVRETIEISIVKAAD